MAKEGYKIGPVEIVNEGDVAWIDDTLGALYVGRIGQIAVLQLLAPNVGWVGENNPGEQYFFEENAVLNMHIGDFPGVISGTLYVMFGTIV